MAKQVAVIGPRDCTDEQADTAHAVGALLAARGAIVICGGMTGVMSAVAAGVRSAKGTVIGILPGRDRSGSSPDLTVAVITGIGEARNAIIVQSADAIIAVGGSWGTLSEIALAKRRGDIPVISLLGWTLYDTAGHKVAGIHEADSPEQAVKLAIGE